MANEKLNYEPVNSENRIYDCDRCGNEVECLGIMTQDDIVLCDDCLGEIEKEEKLRVLIKEE